MSKKVYKILLWIVGILVSLAVILSVVGILVTRRSFPQVDGRINVPGLDDEVYVYRDGYGVPHIFATTTHDLFLAQGYVHAQERFWQMDFWRHIGSGRLAEMFGESQVETDAFLRTLGWEHIAEQEYALYGEESRAILDAYVEGVNDYLATHAGTELSLEYGILRLLNPDYKPEPWQPVHSITWGKAMAWDLRGNMDAEIERAILLNSFSPELVADLFPAYPTDHPVIAPEYGAGDAYSNAFVFEDLGIPAATLAGIRGKYATLDALLGPAGEGIGSNSFALAGSRTSTGAPMLANDPHLGIQMPSIWFQVGLHCRPQSEDCSLEAAGFSFAGVPGIIIGHNGHIAWGFTNVAPDVMDLYIEKVNPNDPTQYEVDGQWVDMELRTETLLVAGSDPVEITIRTTRHGPIITETYDLQDFRDQSGVDMPEQYAIALRWTALEPSTIFEAIWGLDNAQDWDEFRTAASHFDVPSQSLLYADIEGNIGYQMPGKVPIRASGDGSLPVPGWTDAYEWTGYIPFEELPYVFNPSKGYIVTANNAVVGTDYPYLITLDWDYGFRAQRIVDLIEAEPGLIDIAYIQQMQGDSYDYNAETYVPLLNALVIDDPHLATTRDLLTDWDYQARVDSAPAALFEVFWKRLLENTFQDELPAEHWPAGGSRWNEVMRNLAGQPDSPWWDDQNTTERVEGMDDTLATSFAEAVAEIESLLGKNPAKWRWGDLHTATFENQTLGQSGIGPIEALFNRGPFSTGGGESIVNATGWTATEGYFVDWLPSMRMIVDLGDLRNSVTVHTTGQSGHAFHPHYIDLAPMWASLQYYSMLWNEQAILSNAEASMILVP